MNYINLFFNKFKLAQFFVYLASIFVILACVIKFVQLPTFWLDEAWVANAIYQPSLEKIFSRLPNGVVFPRFYLSFIAILCKIFGYKIWVLRFFPTIFFILGTVLWAKLLVKRINNSVMAGFLAGSLLIGSFYWLEQSIQLKQYSLDVFVGLIPFLVDDNFYEKLFLTKKNRLMILFISLPCLFSYTYLMPLIARILGWYLQRLRQNSWHLSWENVVLFFISIFISITAIYLTDYQFSHLDRQAFSLYWKDCILFSGVEIDFNKTLKLILNFFYGWYVGRLLPLVLIAIIPLQILGLWQVVKNWKTLNNATQNSWGSRSLGGLILIVIVILANIVENYPICPGRLLLFLQPHFQILILEGFFLLFSWLQESRMRIIIYLFIAILGFYSLYRYVSFVKQEPWENLNPILSLIKPEISDTLWADPCSVSQITSLPTSLPIKNLIIYKTHKKEPPKGGKVWILWTGLGRDDCRNRLNEIKSKSISWQIIYIGSGAGLALAEF